MGVAQLVRGNVGNVSFLTVPCQVIVNLPGTEIVPALPAGDENKLIGRISFRDEEAGPDRQPQFKVTPDGLTQRHRPRSAPFSYHLDETFWQVEIADRQPAGFVNPDAGVEQQAINRQVSNGNPLLVRVSLYPLAHKLLNLSLKAIKQLCNISCCRRSGDEVRRGRRANVDGWIVIYEPLPFEVVKEHLKDVPVTGGGAGGIVILAMSQKSDKTGLSWGPVGGLLGILVKGLTVECFGVTVSGYFREQEPLDHLSQMMRVLRRGFSWHIKPLYQLKLWLHCGLSGSGKDQMNKTTISAKAKKFLRKRLVFLTATSQLSIKLLSLLYQ